MCSGTWSTGTNSILLIALIKMHICKNVLESLLATLTNMPDKTKDGPKARKDLQDLNIREDLHMSPCKKTDETETETEAREKKSKKVKEEDYCPLLASP